MPPSPFSSPSSPTFKQLRVAVVGGGLGGLSASIALRRAGHIVEIFERRGFDVEVSSFLTCAANGTQWLREWEVDISIMKPIVLQKFVIRDWETGRVLKQFDLEDYEATWGSVHYTFQRQDLHQGLLRTATSADGKGIPCKLVTDHFCERVDCESGTVTFKNGRTVVADIIIGADGIRSVVRGHIGITPNVRAAAVACYRCNVHTETIKRLGLASHACDPAVQMWGGSPGKNGRSQYYRVVLGLCSGGDAVSAYCFMPSELTNHHKEGFEFKEVPAHNILLGRYGELDPDCANLILHSIDRMPWRLYIHRPYEYWHKGKVCIMGDAAHPMFPFQAQGACQAIEDAAALGIIFSDKYGFTNNVEAGLATYERIRKERATKVQQASARGAENTNERIGFMRFTPQEVSLATAEGRLTPNEMNLYKMHDHIATEVGVRSLSSRL